MTKALCKLEEAPQYNIYKCWFFYLMRRNRIDEAKHMAGVGLFQMELFTGSPGKFSLRAKVSFEGFRGIIGSAG